MEFPLTLGEVIAALLIVAFVVNPFSVLVHELGHAAVALKVSVKRVFVEVGDGDRILKLDIRRITIICNRRHLGSGGHCRWGAKRVSPRDRLLVSLGGPAATFSLIVLYGLAALFTAEPSPFVAAIFVMSGLRWLLSLVTNFDLRERAVLGSLPLNFEQRDGIRARRAYRQYRAGAKYADHFPANESSSINDTTLRPDDKKPAA